MIFHRLNYNQKIQIFVETLEEAVSYRKEDINSLTSLYIRGTGHDEQAMRKVSTGQPIDEDVSALAQYYRDHSNDLHGQIDAIVSDSTKSDEEKLFLIDAIVF